MTNEAERTKEIFLEAVTMRTAAERAAFLDAACGADPALAERVQTLLRAHEASDSVLDRPAAEQFSLGPEPTGPATLDNTAAEVATAWPMGDPHVPQGRLGHYRMVELVGQGGFATVFKAFDEKLQRIVAVKVLAPALAASSAARQRFLREARAAAAVRNEHVIAIHAVEETPSPYLVMEFIEGQTLQDKLDKTAPLPVKEVLRIGYQVAMGLAAAHRLGLIHRDIKPGNILLENGVERVKLCDFGLARTVDDASVTQSGQIAGTPLYMSPEQADGRAIDHRSDLFSLGGVLYALCTGHAPFRAGSTLAVLKRIVEDTPRPVRELNTDIPPYLEAVVHRLLSKDPAQRFAGASEVADVLAGCLAELQANGQVARNGHPVLHKEGLHAKRRVPWVRSALLVAGLAAVLIVPTVWLWPTGRPDEQAGPGTAHDLLSSPLDAWKRQDLPVHLLALAGDGDPARAPGELVAVLGTGRFPLSGEQLGGMTVAPTGDLLAVPAGKQLFLFDPKTGQPLRQFTVHEKGLGDVHFTANGKQLITAGDGDNTARLWETASGKLLQVFRGHGASVLSAILSADGKTAITAGADATVRVWQTATGEQLKLLQHPDRIHSLALHPNNELLVTGCHDGLVRVWDLASGDLRQAIPGHTSEVDSLAFSADGKYMASGSKELRLWDAATFQELYTLPAVSHWLGFGPDGRTVLAAKTPHADDEAYVVTRWDVATGKAGPELKLNHRKGWGVFAITPDGKTLFAARQTPDPESSVRAYDTESGKEIFAEQITGHAGQVWSVAFSKDGRLLASGGNDRTVRVWDLAGRRNADGQPPMQVLSGHAQPVWSVRFSPDGNLLASGSLDRTIVLWDVARQRRVRTLRGHSKTYSRIAFAPDGRTIAAGQEDGTIKSWDTAHGHDMELPAEHGAAVRCVAYRADGKLLASAGVDRTVQIHDVDTGQLVRKFTLPTIVDHVAFSADGKQLVATTDFNNPSTLNVWDTDTWQQASYPSHASHAPGLAVSPAGPLALTSGYDRLVRCWDLRSAAATFATIGPGPFGALPAEVAFSPDGRYWATANQNGTITIFRTPALPEARVP